MHFSTISAHKKTDHCPLLFFGASEKRSIHTYGTKLMIDMDYQGHTCPTMVGEKQTMCDHVMASQLFSQLQNMYLDCR
jgi:hypothetical protein